MGVVTLRVLTIKINIVLKMNNSSSSADRREGTGDLRTFRILLRNFLF